MTTFSQGSSHSCQNSPHNICTFLLIHFSSPHFHVLKLNKLISLKWKKSCGRNEVSSFFLKQVLGLVLEPLKILLNDSLSSGVHPDTYKTAKIVLICKIGDQNGKTITVQSLFCVQFQRCLWRLYTQDCWTIWTATIFFFNISLILD